MMEILCLIQQAAYLFPGEIFYRSKAGGFKDYGKQLIQNLTLANIAFSLLFHNPFNREYAVIHSASSFDPFQGYREIGAFE